MSIVFGGTSVNMRFSFKFFVIVSSIIVGSGCDNVRVKTPTNAPVVVQNKNRQDMIVLANAIQTMGDGLAKGIAKRPYNSNVSGSIYKITNVRKTEQNVYTFRQNNVKGVILTKYCYHFSFSDDALLKYDNSNYDNFIVFEDGDKCEVSEVGIF